MKRMVRRSAVGAAVFALTMSWAADASAQAVQSIGLGVGLFAPKTNLHSRDRRDVLVENLTVGCFFDHQGDGLPVCPNDAGNLAFDIADFRGAQVFGEWMLTFDDRVELALGAGFYRRTAPSVYANYTNNDRSEIEQDIQLRVVPLSAVVRFLPFGDAGTTQVYVGGGVSALRWRYSETGDFVDFSDFAIFRDQYVAQGTTIAPVVLGGVRLPLGGDIYALNAELRYQFGKGDLGIDSGFLSDTIDLSGLNFTLGFQVRF